MDPNQEAIPEGSQLKILSNHEVLVGTVFNHLACAKSGTFIGTDITRQ